MIITHGRTWRNVKSATAEEIRNHLLEHGGIEEEVKSAPEAWRIKFSDSTFTYYKKGTLYSTPSNSNDPAVFEAWEYIESLAGCLCSPDKRFSYRFGRDRERRSYRAYDPYWSGFSKRDI